MVTSCYIIDLCWDLERCKNIIEYSRYARRGSNLEAQKSTTSMGLNRLAAKQLRQSRICQGYSDTEMSTCWVNLEISYSESFMTTMENPMISSTFHTFQRNNEVESLQLKICLWSKPNIKAILSLKATCGGCDIVWTNWQSLKLELIWFSHLLGKLFWCKTVQKSKFQIVPHDLWRSFWWC